MSAPHRSTDRTIVLHVSLATGRLRGSVLPGLFLVLYHAGHFEDFQYQWF